MKLVSLTIARNSSWSIKAVITHALRYVDAAVVVLHKSTDDSLDILRKFDKRVTIAKLEDDSWNEMDHRQASLDIGRDLSGTHFLVLDDDEILTNNLAERFRCLASAQPASQCLCLPLLSCWRSLDQYRSDGHALGRAYKTCVFADAPDVRWKAEKGGYQHHHTAPYGVNQIRLLSPDQGGYMHLQHANWERLVIKQTWYMCMELCRWGQIKANYRGTMDETGLKLSPIPPGWWSRERAMLKLEQTPWQLADIRRMVSERGAEWFGQRGVDVTLFLEVSHVQPA